MKISPGLRARNLRRVMWMQMKAAEHAAAILRSECGAAHTLGSRADCPNCIEHARLWHPGQRRMAR